MLSFLPALNHTINKIFNFHLFLLKVLPQISHHQISQCLHLIFGRLLSLSWKCKKRWSLQTHPRPSIKLWYMVIGFFYSLQRKLHNSWGNCKCMYVQSSPSNFISNSDRTLLKFIMTSQTASFLSMKTAFLLIIPQAPNSHIEQTYSNNWFYEELRAVLICIRH